MSPTSQHAMGSGRFTDTVSTINGRSVDLDSCQTLTFEPVLLPPGDAFPYGGCFRGIRTPAVNLGRNTIIGFDTNLIPFATLGLPGFIPTSPLSAASSVPRQSCGCFSPTTPTHEEMAFLTTCRDQDMRPIPCAGQTSGRARSRWRPRHASETGADVPIPEPGTLGPDPRGAWWLVRKAAQALGELNRPAFPTRPRQYPGAGVAFGDPRRGVRSNGCGLLVACASAHRIACSSLPIDARRTTLRRMQRRQGSMRCRDGAAAPPLPTRR